MTFWNVNRRLRREVGSRLRGKGRVAGRGPARRGPAHLSPRRGAFEPLEAPTLLTSAAAIRTPGSRGTTILAGQRCRDAPLSAPPASPAFTRQDNRVDFNWTNSATNFVSPGGSPSPAAASIRWDAGDGLYDAPFSVFWAGDVIPKSANLHLHRHHRGRIAVVHPAARGRLLDDAGERLERRPHGGDPGHGRVCHDRRSDVRHRIGVRPSREGDPAECKLHWSSPSTPDEAIEPVASVGVNFDCGEAALANMVNASADPNWGSGVSTDSSGWPMGKFHVLDLAGRHADRGRGDLSGSVPRHGPSHRGRKQREGCLLGRRRRHRHRLRQHAARRGGRRPEQHHGNLDDHGHAGRPAQHGRLPELRIQQYQPRRAPQHCANPSAHPTD